MFCWSSRVVSFVQIKDCWIDLGDQIFKDAYYFAGNATEKVIYLLEQSKNTLVAIVQEVNRRVREFTSKVRKPSQQRRLLCSSCWQMKTIYNVFRTISNAIKSVTPWRTHLFDDARSLLLSDFEFWRQLLAGLCVDHCARANVHSRFHRAHCFHQRSSVASRTVVGRSAGAPYTTRHFR